MIEELARLFTISCEKSCVFFFFSRIMLKGNKEIDNRRDFNMNNKISVDKLIDKMIESGLTDGIYQIRQDISELKLKKQKYGMNEQEKYEINYLERQLNYYLKASSQVSKFKNELRNLNNEFNMLNEDYIINDVFWSQIQDIQTFRQSDFSHKVYNEMVRSRAKRENVADTIHKFMENNASLAIAIGSKKGGYERISVAGFAKQYGYDLLEVKSSLLEISLQEEKLMKEKYSLVSVGESYLDFDKLQQVVWKNNQNKDVNYVPQIISIYPFNTGNIKSDQIFHDVYKRLEKINYLHQEHQLKITEEEYCEIVSAIKHIIQIYQDIQLLIVTKEAFKNTKASKYFELINKEINNAHNEIAKIYDKLNKYISKLDKDNTLGIIVDKVVDSIDNVVQTVKDGIETPQIDRKNKDLNAIPLVNEDVEKNQDVQSQNDKDKSPVIAIIDSYKQRIAEAEKKVDRSLLTQAQMHYDEVYDGPKGYEAPYGETFYKFLKSFYSGSENMKNIIECERLKDELAGYIYGLWKQSGSIMNFKDYAKYIQGVEIYSPSSYVEEEITKPLHPEKIESYVETKKNNIEKARERYNQKNALWKFFHKKMNPQFLNFDSMTNEQIEQLYSGKRR